MCTYVRVDTRERNTPHTWELRIYRVRVLRATRVSRVRVCQVGCELYCTVYLHVLTLPCFGLAFALG